MNKWRITCVSIFLLAFSLPLCADGKYEKRYMEPWIGATTDELAAQWGYPLSRADLVVVDDSTVVYSYRHEWCRVSFTLKNGVVVGYQYRYSKRPSGCPEIVRKKKPPKSPVEI